MRKLYIHVGTHRTATSSIQSFLNDNAQELRKQGVLRPYGARRHFAVINRLFQDRGKDFAPLEVSDMAQELDQRAETREGDIHSIIISDEDIVMRRDLTRLAALRDTFDVKVVLFVRRQDLWLESWYMQNVKWQWDGSICHLTFAEFMARQDSFHWIDYDTCTAHLEEVFGRENVLVQVFEKDQMPNGPVEAFCSLVGIDQTTLPVAPPHTNSSLSPLMTEFMRHLPLDQMKPPVRLHFERACMRVDNSISKSSEETVPLLLRPKERKRVMARFKYGNIRVARRYFGRDELFLEPMPADDAVLARLSLPADSNEVMTRLVAPLIRELSNIELLNTK